MKFALTIDTEGDNQWDHGRKLSVDNIKFIPRFQRLCEKYNIKFLLVEEPVLNSHFQSDPRAFNFKLWFIIIITNLNI